jgi:GntR family transcriptional regulator, phosphonate transport system regulatory protein
LNTRAASLDRGGGIALWRQIADELRRDIVEGLLVEGAKLPPELALAERFAVNRHTVRAAIAALTAEGVLHAEQGRGTFIRRAPRISYALGRRTRFSTNLEGQARQTRRRLLDHAVEAADRQTAETLGIKPGASIVRLELIAEADGIPISRSTAWFDAERFPDMARTFRKTGSITAAFAAQGVSDYTRRSTMVSARHADPKTVEELGLSPGAIVLATEAIDEDVDGRAIELARTLFAADRVELTVG